MENYIAFGRITLKFCKAFCIMITFSTFILPTHEQERVVHLLCLLQFLSSGFYSFITRSVTFFLWNWILIQGHAHVRQVLYYLSHSPGPFCVFHFSPFAQGWSGPPNYGLVLAITKGVSHHDCHNVWLMD